MVKPPLPRAGKQGHVLCAQRPVFILYSSTTADDIMHCEAGIPGCLTEQISSRDYMRNNGRGHCKDFEPQNAFLKEHVCGWEQLTTENRKVDILKNTLI